jgi:phage gp16-like protein
VAYCKALIKLIHVAKRDLALDDETYRAMLERITGKDSSRDLEPWQLEKVVDHLRHRGFEVRAGNQGAPSCKLANDPQSRMIRALWLKLHKLGAVRNPSETALAKFVKRQTKRDRLEWLSTGQASDVIEALKDWVLRVGGEIE